MFQTVNLGYVVDLDRPQIYHNAMLLRILAVNMVHDCCKHKLSVAFAMAAVDGKNFQF